MRYSFPRAASPPPAGNGPVVCACCRRSPALQSAGSRPPVGPGQAPCSKVWPLGGSFLFEQGFESGAGIGSGRLLLLSVFAKHKKFAEISRLFIEHRIGIGLAAGVSIMGVVESTV